MIVFFGKHEIIDQWREVIGDDTRFAFCESYQQLSHFTPKSCIVVYVRIPNKASLRIALKLKLKGYKVAKFWAGTDSRYFNDARGIEKLYSKIIYKLCINNNLSPAPWLSQVLESNGLKTQYWQSCSPIFLLEEQLSRNNIPTSESKPIKKVLVYSNPDRHWIYNTDRMLALSKKLPHINFIFVGDNTIKTDSYPNVTSLGRIDQNRLFSLFKECDILLRITSHDGFSRMAIEAMYFGMQVITNWPVPYTIECHTDIAIEEALQQPVTFNLEGYNYIRREFNVSHWKSTLVNALK
ncbi:hypothetical protein [Thalassotalea castellviae]|uniref:Glycosyltransferase family 1 protein n=1 Tax=Thalassotalea castellviae TaxID=3075612 RepID=A0ABU3A3W8_9GAMM|nr:hypothetical protein [Thalassotalea sp. W431]MDT0603808.1 hypothetical protein [Thalassotalea sp. W431]